MAETSGQDPNSRPPVFELKTIKDRPEKTF